MSALLEVNNLTVALTEGQAVAVSQALGTRRGIATECIGGGLGGAMLIEAV